MRMTLTVCDILSIEITNLRWEMEANDQRILKSNQSKSHSPKPCYLFFTMIIGQAGTVRTVNGALGCIHNIACTKGSSLEEGILRLLYNRTMSLWFLELLSWDLHSLMSKWICSLLPERSSFLSVTGRISLRLPCPHKSFPVIQSYNLSDISLCSCPYST